MDLEFLEKVKRLAIIAMFSDDDLLDILVLKGGNALDIVHKVTSRASKDLDFSIEGDFSKEEIGTIKSKIEKALQRTFNEAGYLILDLKFTEEPKKISPEVADFWGGYKAEFKIIEKIKAKKFSSKEELRRHAIAVDEGHKKKFYIDISKFEYCSPKMETTLDGYTIYVYTPEMIIFEKLRALCQKIPKTEYTKLVKSHSEARARDFFDIYVVLNNFGHINFTSKQNILTLRKIFETKKVPLKLIGEIEKYREFHRADFSSVQSTVKRNTKLKDFDFYFNQVIDLCNQLKTLWEV